MIIEQLTQEEKDMIDYYREAYAPNDDGCVSSNNWAPVEKILTPWATAKSHHLYQLLGNQLMVSKEIAYEKNKEELLAQMLRMRFGTKFGTDTRKEYSGEVFINAFLKLIQTVARQYDKSDPWQFYARSYINEDYLVNNAYGESMVDFPLPSGKSIQVKAGAKPMRILSKIARAYNLPGFEDFRIAHSLILNQKHIYGTMTLSIHPLDYMTMSDNNCGWDSCMQWTGEGSYRQGTVEMMNSPTVVVVYMNAHDPYVLGKDYKWSNKKWRQLFVVDYRSIVAIKAYPYQNDELTKTAMDWIVELARKNLGWKIAEPRWINPDDTDALFFEGLVDSALAPSGHIGIALDCGNMYNDLGALFEHLVAPAEDLNENDIDNCYYPTHYLLLPYSGASECMLCGAVDPDFDDESCLICDDCMSFTRCEYCDERISPNDGYSVDGRYICSYCYDNHVFTCNYCGEEHLKEDLMEIRVMPRLSTEYMRIARENWQNLPYYSRGNYIPSNPEEVEFNFYVRYPTYYVCRDSYCREDWKNSTLKPGAAIHNAEISWDRYEYVYLDELTDEAAEEIPAFRYKNPDESMEMYNQAYINWLADCGCNTYPLLELSQS